MAAEKDSHTQELSRAIDAAYSDYKPSEPSGEDRLYRALLAQAEYVVLARLRQEDPDLAQGIVRRAMVALKGFRAESKLSTWFFRITQNEVNRALERVVEERKTEVLIDKPSPWGSFQDPSDPPVLREQAEKVYTAIQNARHAKLDVDELGRELPPKQKEVIALMAEGYSLEEIAEKTGEKIGTTRSRYRLAKEKMAARAKGAKK